ncbi:MAG: pilus assembly protein TadG-related protein, partial [Acidobacteria bacterium]|nr:pilus assembly protein TadG-related protein [Acidobacteriota bacterium]
MSPRPHPSGSMSLQLLIILVPVLFAFMGFAFDLGRLYLIKGELSQAAASMALVSAQKLIGTTDSLDKATEAANQIVDDSTGHGAKYNFGSLLIGQSNGLLSSELNPPAFYATMAAATAGSEDSIFDQADGTAARHAQVTLRADAPLLFWSLFSLGQSRSTPVVVQAVAGLSAPVCTACDIEPIAIPAQGITDPTEDPNFGFTAGSKYTFAYQCTATGGTNPPSPLSGTGSVIPYLLIDRYTDSTDVDETQQVYRIGAQGLLPSTSIAKACVQVGASESVWGTNGGTSGNPAACASPPPVLVQYMMCGLYTRFLSDMPTVCQNNITSVDEMVSLYQPDTDITSIDD